jgi:hypothetical protein
MRLWDDGTDIKGALSNDGSHWTMNSSIWYQDGRTAFLNSGGNQVGVFMNSANGGNSGAGPADTMMSIESFSVEDL